MDEPSLLLDRCRRGDALAWEALVRRLQGRVFAVTRHYLRDPEEARDAAQEIFVRLWRHLDALPADAAFVPWLLQLARNLCIDRLRRLRAKSPPGAVAIEEGVPVAAGGQDAEEAAIAGERERLLYRALDRLTEANREMILLKEIQGLKLEEIADLLEVPLGTVKSRSSRARVELAQAIRRLEPSYGA